jgi:exopolysaccharide biosynthesis WecB/TagA/CpsF family protein
MSLATFSPAPALGLRLAPVHPLPRPAASSGRWPVSILGVPLDAVTADEALTRIAGMVAARRPHYVVTPNVDFMVQARRNPELQRILSEADLVLCDGQPLVWASRLLGNPLPERVAGADLTPRLLAQAEKLNHRIFLLGATAESNAGAVARLQADHPRLQVVGAYAPPFRPLDEMDNAEIIARIRAAAPDLLFVSFGCPKQEKWIARHYRELGVPVCLGVGATIDFLAGRVRRAPQWMRRTGLEWTYRLQQEPRRLFRRYLTDFCCFGPDLLAQWWAQRRWSKARGGVDVVSLTPPCVQLRAHGTLDREVLEQHAAVWGRLNAGECDFQLDLGATRFIDSTFAAALAVWHRRLSRAGFRLSLVGPAAHLGELLRRAGLRHLETAGIAPRLAA